MKMLKKSNFITLDMDRFCIILQCRINIYTCTYIPYFTRQVLNSAIQQFCIKFQEYKIINDEFLIIIVSSVPKMKARF